MTDLSLRPLPTPTQDVEVAKRDMDEFGYALIANALSQQQVSAIIERLMEQAKGEAKAAVASPEIDGETATARIFKELNKGKVSAGGSLDVDGETSTARVFNLLNKGKVWRAMIDPTDTVHQVLEHVFTPCFDAQLASVGGLEQKYLLSSTGAKFKHKDTFYKQRGFHIDQKWAAGHQDYPLVCTAFYALSDFNVENGCTWVVPGSHKVPAPRLEEYYTKGADLLEKAVPLAAPAGTCAIFEGRTWHAEGVNTSGEIRIHLNGYHCAPYMRQRELFSMNLRQDVIDELSDEQLKLLGFESSLLYNLIEPTLGRKNVGMAYPAGVELRG